MGIKKCLPIDKKAVLHKQSFQRSDSRKAKTFLKVLEKINQGSDYPGFTLLHENFAVSWGKIAFRSILISRFRQIDEFSSSSKK